MSWGRGVRCVRGKQYKWGQRETGACRGAESTVRGTWGHDPRGVGGVSEADILRCLTGDVNEKGCAVRDVWAVGEGLRYGCGGPKGHQARGVGVGGWALTSPRPRDAAVTPRLVRPRPGPMTGLCLALGRPDRRGPPRRLRCPAPPAPPHRLGRVATAAAAAAATTSSRHSPAPRTLRARRGRGPKPYSDWLSAGQPPLEAADIGGHEADEQLLKPITEGWRRDYWERQWGPRVVQLGERRREARARRREQIGAAEEDGQP